MVFAALASISGFAAFIFLIVGPWASDKNNFYKCLLIEGSFILFAVTMLLTLVSCDMPTERFEYTLPNVSSQTVSRIEQVYSEQGDFYLFYFSNGGSEVATKISQSNVVIKEGPLAVYVYRDRPVTLIQKMASFGENHIQKAEIFVSHSNLIQVVNYQ